MIVDDITNTREDIKKLLYFEEDINVVGEAEDGKEAIRIAEELRPDIILMDVNLPRMDGITATEHISVKVPESAIIIISIQGEQDYLRKAMAAGARDYLVKPFSSSDLSETIRRVDSLTVKRRRFFLSEYEASEKQAYKVGEPSKTIVFFSGKGGTGKTSVACNFAVALAQLSREEVALIDADLQGGDLSLLLNLELVSTLADLVREDEIDLSTIEEYMIPHLSGVKVLPSPSAPDKAENIGGEHLKIILECLKEKYKYIVIDTAAHLDRNLIAVLETADEIILVLNQDMMSLKQTALDLEVLEALGLSKNSYLILNKKTGDLGLKQSDITGTLKREFRAVIPKDEKTVLNSINKGLPYVMGYANTAIARVLTETAAMWVGKGDQTRDKPVQKAENKPRPRKALAGIFGF